MQSLAGYAAFLSVAVFLPLYGALYATTFPVMIAGWSRDDYSYCYLIPFVVAYLIWEQRRRLAAIPLAPSWTGVLVLTLGLGLYLLGELGGEYYTLYGSSWLVLLGFTWACLGWPMVKSLGFPFVLLLTLFPLPGFAYNNLSVKLQLVSSQLGAAMIRLYGLSAYREGNVIDLGFTQLEVVEACNGLRYLIPLIVLGLILAYFYKAPLWKRAILVFSTAPLAVAFNGLRIALMGILGSIWGTGVIEGFSHDLSGWVVFMASVGILLGEIRLMKGIGRSSSISGLLRSEFSPTTDTASIEQTPKRSWFDKARLWLPQSLVGILLLAGILAFSQGIEFRERIPIKRPFSQFPLQIDAWKGRPQFLEQNVISELDLSDYVMLDYRNQDGSNVNFYAAYYETQRKGKSIHTPATCLPGSGWVFKESEAISFPLSNGKTLSVSRAFMEKGNMKQLTYYWFPQRGRVLTNLYQLKFFVFWDALTRQRTDGALVRLITPVRELEPVEQCDKRLQEFTRALLPALDEFIPGENP